MHPNPIYHDTDIARNLSFARERGFGVLAVNGNARPLLSHVPFFVSQDGASAELHLVRSNPIARAIDKALPCTIAVSGPDAYISPDWYGVEDQVPTWNYVAVHLTGVLERLPHGDLRGVLNRLSAHNEEALLPKAPWTAEKMTAQALDKMMRQIVPFRMMITSVDGTWKLNQNKTPEVRTGAANGVEAARHGVDSSTLAALMRDV